MRIEVSRWLVRQHDGRFGHDGAGDGYALLLAARENLRSVGSTPSQPDSFERFADAGSDEPRREPHHFEGDCDVVEDGPVGHELEVLVDDADVAAQGRDAVVGEARDVTPKEEHAPLVEELRAVNQTEKRALSGAGRAGDEHELSPLDRERHAAKNGLVCAIGLVNVLENQDRPLRCGTIVAMSGAQRGAKRGLRRHRDLTTSRGKRGKLFGGSGEA